MTSISFEGRVAIVTGAGGGLGRSHALELARRGAKVVVNDLGGNIRGEAGGHSMADTVVEEIIHLGGDAIANYDSVATPEGGRAIVDAAVERYGRLDIVVNNAGNIRNGRFTELSPEAVDSLLAVHVKGAFNVTQPAFEVMRNQGYGRIVFTSSSAGFFGGVLQANYAAAKTALLGLSNVIALEGRPHNIYSNLILPAADSRMAEDMSAEQFEGGPTTAAHYEPEMVTAMVVWLASEVNTSTHEAFSVVRGRYGRVFVGVTEGWHVPLSEPVPSVEDIRDHIDVIRDQSSYTTPLSMPEEFAGVK